MLADRRTRQFFFREVAMLPKVLAGVLLAVVFAAVTTLGVVYFGDYSSSPQAEPTPTSSSHSDCGLSIADAPCCGAPADADTTGPKCTQAPVDASK
jgi:hypothetical protein